MAAANVGAQAPSTDSDSQTQTPSADSNFLSEFVVDTLVSEPPLLPGGSEMWVYTVVPESPGFDDEADTMVAESPEMGFDDEADIKLTNRSILLGVC